MRWPTGLAYRLVWTGLPASTRDKLGKLGTSAGGDSRAGLVSAAEAMAGAWESATAVLSQFPAYIEKLRQFSVDHDLGIFDAGHDQLATDAMMAGLVYKPCGAGGGDVGILLGPDEDELDDFMASQSASACKVLACELEQNGVELEQH